MKSKAIDEKSFDPKASILRARSVQTLFPKWRLESEGREYVWTNRLERVGIIRIGIPYSAIEVVCKRIDIPVKELLRILGLPQTTYNKKLREKSLLNGRDSELILLLVELIDFGIEVFNREEEKFQRWLKKQNSALGGITPESLLDSISGVQEVKNCLNRLEYGNLA